MPAQGVADLAGDIETQRRFLEARAPGYARVLAELSRMLGDVAPRLEAAWHDRRFDAWYERPLLLLGALRYDAMAEGPAHPLYRAVAAEPPDAMTVTPGAVAEAFAPGRERLYRALSTRIVQTNETTRAVAWMWVAHLIESVDPGRPCVLVDLGASAGLNLVADALSSIWDDQHGRAIPTRPLPPVVGRIGIDRNPLDARQVDTRAWLRACVWPGDSARLERLESAFSALDAATEDRAVTLVACDLGDAPGRLAAIDAPSRVLAMQTIVRDYVPRPVRERYEVDMRAWLASRAPGRAVWVEFEPGGGDDQDRLVVLAAHVRGREGAVSTFELARTHPHPRRLFVDEAAVAAFVGEVRAGASLAD